MEYVVRRITEAISTGTPRERIEQAALAFLTYVRDQPDGFAILAQASLMNDVAERVGDVFASSFKAAGFEPKTAPIYAHALVGTNTIRIDLKGGAAQGPSEDKFGASRKVMAK